MGYTHYWNLKKDIPNEHWTEISSAARKLMKHYPYEEDFASSVSIGKDVIQMFGGEMMELTRRSGGKNDFSFCKTNHCEADLIVCALLSVAAQSWPHLHVSSDAQMGETPNGWPHAVKWASEVLGYEVRLPWKQPRPEERMKTPVNTVKQLVKLIRSERRSLVPELAYISDAVVRETGLVNDRAAERHKETKLALYIGFGVLSAALFAREGADMYVAHEYAKKHQIITIHDQPGCDANPDEPKGMIYTLPSVKPFSPKI